MVEPLKRASETKRLEVLRVGRADLVGQDAQDRLLDASGREIWQDQDVVERGNRARRLRGRQTRDKLVVAAVQSLEAMREHPFGLRCDDEIRLDVAR